MLRGLLVTHGDLGASLLATACGIVGAAPGVEAISNHGQSREGLTQLVDAALTAWGEEPGIVLTDIHGGSCAQAALSGAIGRRGTPVVTGVNLPMLVKVARHKPGVDIHELAETARDYGRRNISVASELLAEKKRDA